MKKIILLILTLVMFLPSCTLLNQGKELQNLFNCKYSLDKINIKNIAGIDISNFSGNGNIPTDVYLSLMQKVMTKDVNTSFEFLISVNNPTEKPAGSQGLDWMLQLKGNSFAQGKLDSTLFIEPKGNTHFKVNAQINLFNLINSASLPEILTMINNKDWKKLWKESGLEVKIKPWYKIGNEVNKYPGYITIKP